MRHEPLVAPEPVGAPPGKAGAEIRPRQQLIETLRRRAAGQADGKSFRGGARRGAEPLGGVAGQRLGVGMHDKVFGGLGHGGVAFRCGAERGIVAQVARPARAALSGRGRCRCGGVKAMAEVKIPSGW